MPMPPSSPMAEKDDGVIAQRMQDLELKTSAQTEKDAEETEVVRLKKMIQETREEGTKYLDEREARWNKDKEAEWKQALEEMKEERKKDVEQRAETWSKLQQEVKELEGKVERLENDLKAEQEDTRQYVDVFVDDVIDFIADGDQDALDRMKRRELVDRAQAKLAVSLDIASTEVPFRTAAFRFRQALGPSSKPLDERMDTLRQIAKDKKDKLSGRDAKFLDGDAVSMLARPYYLG